ncbi:glycosyltransferase family 2 protein [uncultured Imperialibacter sp.]|uniref:glycosyltransferase family A protein n=1 Tax=uncultured Imperialibacter sp. TaxID=1672639 RepID=UPI0030DC9E84|tara:strand:+ start:112204 stop:113142 length:939 start_codon:yes stop_codon:yes gene_type:complete
MTLQISVVIPVYNAARFIKIAVESALAQPEVAEIILVEDGSEDQSLIQCKHLVQIYDRVVLYTHPNNVNKGAGASRNLGIKNSSFDYIAFLDADDYYLPGRFEAENRIFEEHKDVDGVYGALGSELLDDFARDKKEETVTTVSGNVPPERLFYEMAPIGQSGWFSGVALTVKKNAFQRTGLFDVELRLSQDTHMWIKMALKLKLVPGECGIPVAVRGIHQGNRVHNSSKIMEYRPTLFRKLLEWYSQDRGCDDKTLILWDNYLKYYLIVHNPGRTGKVFFLIRAVIQFPFLASNRCFWQQWPLLGRIWKQHQ